MPVIEHLFQRQVTGYYCGPAAVRVALSCHTGLIVAQDRLALELGTTTNGTDSSADVVRVLTAHGIPAAARYIPGHVATGQEAAQLWADVITTIDAGNGLVANVAGTIRTQDGSSYAYPGGHYVTITGYDLADRAVFVADVAVREYWADINNVADWIATRGYAYAGGTMAEPTNPQQPDIDAWRLDALTYGHDKVQGGPMVGEDMWTVQTLKRIERALAAGAGGGATADQVADELRDRLQQ